MQWPTIHLIVPGCDQQTPSKSSFSPRRSGLLAEYLEGADLARRVALQLKLPSAAMCDLLKQLVCGHPAVRPHGWNTFRSLCAWPSPGRQLSWGSPLPPFSGARCRTGYGMSRGCAQLTRMDQSASICVGAAMQIEIFRCSEQHAHAGHLY